MADDTQGRIVAYKGFDKNLICNPTGDKPFQYKIGKTFKSDAEIVRCAAGGFHSCEFPLDVFGYYAPGQSRYCEVEAAGKIARDDNDTKIASAEITIKAELKIPDMVDRAVKWILDRIEDTKRESNTGDRSAATNTGYRSAATNTGDRSAATNTGYRSAATNTGYRSAATNTGNQSAATNTGDRSAATNTGDRSAATNTGNQSAATNTGDRSAAEVSGKHSIAASLGTEGKAKAGPGGAIVLCYRKPWPSGELVHIRASKVGDNGIKPDVWYELDEAGEFVEVAQ
jgi:hypothetical protein